MRPQAHEPVLASAILQSTVDQQRRLNRRHRYEPTVVYIMAERARARGVDLEAAEGPWRPDVRALRRPGRNSLHNIPLVTNGQTEVMVDTPEHAADVAGLLNWAGVEQLEPDQDLRPAGEPRSMPAAD